ncbi:hypothetical protein CTI14_53575, partial [Methylobacterium radiotolerans]
MPRSSRRGKFNRNFIGKASSRYAITNAPISTVCNARYARSSRNTTPNQVRMFAPISCILLRLATPRNT